MNKKLAVLKITGLILAFTLVGCSNKQANTTVELPTGAQSLESMAVWYSTDNVSALVSTKTGVEKKYIETLLSKIQISDYSTENLDTAKSDATTVTVYYQVPDYDWLLSEIMDQENGLVNDLSNVYKLSASDKEITEYCYSVANGFLKNNELQLTENSTVVNANISTGKYDNNVFVLQYIQNFTETLVTDLKALLEDYEPTTASADTSTEELQLKIGSYSLIPYGLSVYGEGADATAISTNVALRINAVYSGDNALAYLSSLSKNNSNLTFGDAKLLVIDYSVIATEDSTPALSRFCYFGEDKKLYKTTKPQLMNLPNVAELPKAIEQSQVAILAVPVDATEFYWYDEILGLTCKVPLDESTLSEFKLEEGSPDSLVENSTNGEE